jgi:hypothetical protein
MSNPFSGGPCMLSLLLLLFGFPLLPYAQKQDSQRVRIDTRLKQLLADPQAKVTDIQNGATEAVPATNRNIQLQPEQALKVIKSGKAIRRTDTSYRYAPAVDQPRQYTLPETYVARLESGAVSILQPLFQMNKPLQYDPIAGLFRGELIVFLKDPDNPQDNLKLAQPIHMRVLSSVDEVIPEQLIFDHANLPDTTVVFRERNPQDSIQIKLITSATPEGYETYLSVEPAILIESGARTIQGWGIQSVPVTVVLRGTTVTEAVEITLQASPGSVTPSQVYVTSEQSGTARLRSEGVGSATLRAISPRFETTEVELSYQFPFRFFIFALLGGLLGSLVYALRRKRKNEPIPVRTHLIGGVLWGLLVAIIYAAGFEKLIDNFFGGLLPVYDYFSEILILGVAALAANLWLPREKQEG